jgi:hypothetical protein
MGVSIAGVEEGWAGASSVVGVLIGVSAAREMEGLAALRAATVGLTRGVADIVVCFMTAALLVEEARASLRGNASACGEAGDRSQGDGKGQDGPHGGGSCRRTGSVLLLFMAMWVGGGGTKDEGEP